ncbi:hypothetical protein BJF93_22365 [Xaviernesmea oryzae]|uniref:Uncharacterized protein n=1 Tax=Xaviernesmea oryzae TaxID=464029 RepID=A0A1Q9B329_9HYPH|nr:hypothetical protein [Xaviernesmea oryzae]OLP62412.1 hypothetical protein BJF93_22365 [Xaviernesmea oryzae]SEM15593.1 hypothetical protein SAMN04487976_1213 [Xaviernesmea oryzae]
MSICICVSGQIRAPDASFRNLLEATKGSDVTFVFSVWSKIGRRSDGFVSSAQLFRMFDIDVCWAMTWSWLSRRITDFSPEIFHYVEAQADIQARTPVADLIRGYFPDAVIDVEQPDELDLSFNEVRQDMNSLRMLYKVWRANEIKRKIEARTGKKFDYVVRMRSDFRLNYLDEDLIRRKCTDTHIFVDGRIPGTLWADDSLAIGTSEAIDIYASLFGRAISERSRWDYIHRDLARHLEENSISFSVYGHHGYITPDKTLTLVETIACLQKQQASGHSWTGVQEISLLSLETINHIRRGKHSLAEQSLAKAIEVCASESLQCDGLLFSAALLEGKIGNVAQALVLIVLSSASRRAIDADQHWEVSRRVVKLCVRLEDLLAVDNPAGFADETVEGMTVKSASLGQLLALARKQLGQDLPEAFSTQFRTLISTAAFEHFLQLEDASRRSALVKLRERTLRLN